MGICSHAKEIICSSRLCDVPVYVEEGNPRNAKDGNTNNVTIANENNNNNINNKNQNNENNNSNNKNCNETTNNLSISIPPNPLTENKEEKPKQLIISTEINVEENKFSTEKEEKVQKKEQSEKKEKLAKSVGKKKVSFINSTKDLNHEPNRENRPRGRSIISVNKKLVIEENCTEGNDNENNRSTKRKFERSNKKSATLVDKAFKFSAKLKGVEMKIPVIQETFVTQKFGDPDKYYVKIKDLGSGSFGSVYKARNLILDNIVAIKMIEKVQDNMVDDLEIKNEIDILKTLSHPNIVRVYEFFDTVLYYYIVTEYCKKGELFSYIKNTYSERQLAILFYQVLSGLCYLHEKKILHRDLKLENIMVSETENDIRTGEEYFWIKIIDFGTAKIFEKNKIEKTVIGSSYYIAPEVLKQRYNEKCDTWSVGVILYMTLVHVAPFDGKTDEEILKRIEIGKYNRTCRRFMEHSEEVRDLVGKLLEKDIDKRLSAKDALKHPCFEKFGGRSLFSNFHPEDAKPYIENLFHYKYNSKLQELVIAFLVHNSGNNDETLIILKIFRHFNKSGDCKLTKSELTEALYDYKDSEEVDEMVDVIFERLDGDNNGYIEYEEFLRLCIDKKKLMTKENLKYAFKFLDNDDTKTLSAQKILKFFLTKPNKEFEAVFNIYLKEVDKDGDGIIDFNEFCELMMKIQ